MQLVNSRPLEDVLDLLDEPPWEPLPTATPPPSATLNPLSEVEMATAAAAALGKRLPRNSAPCWQP